MSEDDVEEGMEIDVVDVTELSGLELEFKKVVENHQSEIDEKLKEAADALDKAVELSEKYGIPFYSRVSPLGQCFYPDSFGDKFSDVSRDLVQELCETYSEYENSWDHSAVC